MAAKFRIQTRETHGIRSYGRYGGMTFDWSKWTTRDSFPTIENARVYASHHTGSFTQVRILHGKEVVG